MADSCFPPVGKHNLDSSGLFQASPQLALHPSASLLPVLDHSVMHSFTLPVLNAGHVASVKQPALIKLPWGS